MSQLNKISYLEDEKIKIARGQVKGVRYFHKFGATPSQSTNTYATVWDKSDTLYPWSTWDAGANTVTVGSSSASDIGHQVVIIGLDSNYDEITETVNLVTQNENSSVNSFSRVYRAFCIGSTSNIGTISIKNGTTDVALISAGIAQTLMTVLTVPKNYTGYLYQFICSAQAGADASGHIFVRNASNLAFRTMHSFEVNSGANYNYNFSFPLEIPEKADIDVRLQTRTNNGRYTACFDLLLVKNPNT